MNDAISIIIMFCCDDLQVHQHIKMHGGSGRLRRTKGHLDCRPPKHEATYSVKGTVYSIKLKSCSEYKV